ncbi:TetR family transcriptional regulator [Mycolicibacterium monacense]|uniref:TetR family transcriptional regulator n=2 Tax=Mycolicibacterium monacense TaxID=85693 RepID=A0AAD1N237_MYCMB|nr:TetR family transcriptional regulator [Mycolicibacterium monacense]
MMTPLIDWNQSEVYQGQTMTPPVKRSARQLRSRQTRERILGAAIAEFTSSGMAGADVGAIVAAAGVAHGTFFFHFPSKEHVLLELERREEARMAADFTRFLGGAHDLATALTHLVGLVSALEQRFGPRLFKELLALHFSPTRPTRDEWTDHPVIVSLVRAIERASGDGEVHPEVDAFYSSTFFLLGLYGALTTTEHGEARDTMLAKLVTTALRGLTNKEN